MIAGDEAEIKEELKFRRDTFVLLPSNAEQLKQV